MGRYLLPIDQACCGAVPSEGAVGPSVVLFRQQEGQYVQCGDAVPLFPRRSKVSPSWLSRRRRCCSPSGPSWLKRNCPTMSSQRAQCSVHTWRRKTKQRYVRLLVGAGVFHLPAEVSASPPDVNEPGSLQDENPKAACRGAAGAGALWLAAVACASSPRQRGRRLPARAPSCPDCKALHRGGSVSKPRQGFYPWCSTGDRAG